MKTKYLFLFTCILLLFLSACKKPEQESLPIIYTIQPIEITTTKAVFRATVNDSSHENTAVGFEWKKNTESDYKNSTVQTNKDDYYYSFLVTDLEEDTKYVVKAFTKTSSGKILYGEEISFFTHGTITDIDGNTYLTMRYYDKFWMSDRIWMTENLRVTRLADGTPIEARSGGKLDDSDGSVYVYDYRHTAYPSNPNFGLLYNEVAAKGVCPEGWHLPLQQDWNNLISLCGGPGMAANMMKTATWSESPYISNNYSQFSIEPAGCYGYWNDEGDFRGVYESAYLWCRGVPHCMPFLIVRRFSKIEIIAVGSSAACSVRCVKD